MVGVSYYHVTKNITTSIEIVQIANSNFTNACGLNGVYTSHNIIAMYFTSMIKSAMPPNQLKQSWTVAAENARSNLKWKENTSYWYNIQDVFNIW